MQNLFFTQPDTIREVLAHVDLNALSADAKQLVNDLQDMADKVDPEHSGGNIQMNLCDLNSYYSTTLWSGKEDVAYLLDNGEIDEDLLQHILPEDLPRLIEKAAADVPWSDDVFLDCSACNEAIRETIESVFAEYIAEKSFVFEDDIFFEADLTTGYWYGDLRSSDFLMNKLQKEALTPIAAEMLRTDPLPFFSASFDVSKQAVAISAAFVLGTDPKSLPDSVQILLTREESNLLISEFENRCKHQYNGRDCLTALNDARKAENLPPLKRSLDVAIRSAQDNLPSSNQTQQKTTLSR